MHNSVEDIADGSLSDNEEPEHDLELVHPSVGKIEPEVTSLNITLPCWFSWSKRGMGRG